MDGHPIPSVMKSLQVPTIGTTDPALLVQAGKRPLRVVVSNNGGNLVFLAHNVADFAEDNVAPSEVFQLRTNADVVVVLQPEQSLVAMAQGGGGQVSIAVSEAMLKEWLQS